MAYSSSFLPCSSYYFFPNESGKSAQAFNEFGVLCNNYLSFSFLRFETYDADVNSPSRLGKRMRIAATNIVNVNVSAANLGTLVGTILSWRRQLELEQKATKLIEVNWNLHLDFGLRRC